MSRHTDDGSRLHGFAGEVWVFCIRCHSPGVVSATTSGYRWHAQFDCCICGLKPDTARGDWVGPVTLTGRRPCGHCGHKWLQPVIRQTAWPREAITSVATPCEACTRHSLVMLQAQACATGADVVDPHFGMPLWLVDDGRHGALWAYNADHLQALKSFVNATLRGRSSQAGNASMISRLPRWMKSAKHRAALTRRLDKLERQLARATGRRALHASP